jgi:hypothetical protein
MKLEIHIPELAELNTNVRQLIDTLNDLGCVAYAIANKQGREKPAAAQIAAEAIAAVSPATEVEPEKPKRTRKTKAEEPAPSPDNGTGAEVITYAVGEHGPAADPNGGFEISQDLRDKIASSISDSQPDQPAAAVEPEPQPEPEPEAPTYVLADCTALSPKLQTAGKLDEAKAWLKKHGADRLKDLDPSHYGAFITFAEGLLG